MKQSRKMNEEIFKNNLMATINEFDYHATPKFKITPVYDSNKMPYGDDDCFRLVVLGEDNIGGKILSLNDTVEVLSCFSPHVPTQIKVVYHGDKDGISLFELLTSTRVRKPSQLANIDTGQPPFKAIR
jgi:hypothetical protein